MTLMVVHNIEHDNNNNTIIIVENNTFTYTHATCAGEGSINYTLIPGESRGKENSIHFLFFKKKKNKKKGQK